MMRWFKAKIYICGEYRATTVYWLPADSPLIEGVNRQEVRTPIETGDTFYFDGQGNYQCKNPFDENGWVAI